MVGRASVIKIQESWLQVPSRSKIFFTSCAPFPYWSDAQWEIYKFSFIEFLVTSYSPLLTSFLDYKAFYFLFDRYPIHQSSLTILTEITDYCCTMPSTDTCLQLLKHDMVRVTVDYIRPAF